MRIVFTIMMILILNLPVLAEEKTLLSGKVEHGGFGAPVVKFTAIKDDFAVLVGGRGGWIINHMFSIGGGGYGLVNQDIDERVISPDTTIFMTMGYGGLILEYISGSDNLVHLSVSSLIGAGGIDYVIKDRYDRWDDHNNNLFDGDAFFVFEPAVNAEINVASFFRVDTGISYRFISGIDTEGLSDSDLSNISAQIELKFGKF